MAKFWTISQMDCIPNLDGTLKDYVVTVHWNRLANETVDGKEYNARVYGAQSFPVNNVENFTPYEELTYEQVCGWLDSTLDVTQLDLTLDNQIQNQINPPIVSPPLPFVNLSP